MFDSLGKDSQKSSNLLSHVSNNGYSPCGFQVSQIMMDRSKDLYAACKKGGRQESRGDDRKTRDETGELINQLKVENSKLNAMLEQLSNER